MLQPTPQAVVPYVIEITFTPSVDATNYTVFYTSDNGITWNNIIVTGSPAYISVDPIAECGKTYSGYVVTNCSSPNPPLSLQVPFPNVSMPNCPPPTACSGNYQAIVMGTGPLYITKKISNTGVYNPADASSPFTILGSINASVLSITGFYITGNFSHINGEENQSIMKLTCGNIKDTSFRIGDGLNRNYAGNEPRISIGRGYAIAHDPTRNRVYVGGDFSQYNSANANNFVAINTVTGVIDPAFVMGSGFENTAQPGVTYGFADVRSIVIQPDGKILVGGYFHTYNGTPVNRLVRLMPDGSIDPSFIARIFSTVNPTTYVHINDIVLDTDGSIFVTGHFTKYDGADSAMIAKLTSTGIKDPIFNVGTNINITPMSIIQAFGTRVILQNYLLNSYVILTGAFTKYGSTTTNSLIRLDKTTGALDPLYIKDTVNYIDNNAMCAFTTLKKAPNGYIILAGLTSASSFQGITDRKNYYILNPSNLSISTLYTTTTPPVTQMVQNVLIKYTP